MVELLEKTTTHLTEKEKQFLERALKNAMKIMYILKLIKVNL